MEEANNALVMINNVSLDGRRLRVEKAKVNRTLFIAKMNRSITNLVLATLVTRTTRANWESVAWRGVWDQKLREAVESYGPVESVTVIKNHHTQKSKGCGFVKFVFREDAMAAYLVRVSSSCTALHSLMSRH
jgi:RNA recognition motif-containing protein